MKSRTLMSCEIGVRKRTLSYPKPKRKDTCRLILIVLVLELPLYSLLVTM